MVIDMTMRDEDNQRFVPKRVGTKVGDGFQRTQTGIKQDVLFNLLVSPMSQQAGNVSSTLLTNASFLGPVGVIFVELAVNNLLAHSPPFSQAISAR